MKKYFIIAGALVALAVPSAAMADVTNNGTTNDAQGYCIANHIAQRLVETTPFNGDHNGIGHIRSEQTGKAIAASAGNRVPAEHCITDAGQVGPDQQQRLRTPLIGPTSAPGSRSAGHQGFSPAGREASQLRRSSTWARLETAQSSGTVNGGRPSTRGAPRWVRVPPSRHTLSRS